MLPTQCPFALRNLNFKGIRGARQVLSGLDVLMEKAHLPERQHALSDAQAGRICRVARERSAVPATGTGRCTVTQRAASPDSLSSTCKAACGPSRGAASEWHLGLKGQHSHMHLQLTRSVTEGFALGRLAANTRSDLVQATGSDNAVAEQRRLAAEQLTERTSSNGASPSGASLNGSSSNGARYNGASYSGNGASRAAKGPAGMQCCPTLSSNIPSVSALHLSSNA